MGRPREFTESEVLGRALQTFWARGYEATSVADLVEATGLSRASLYGAFGDKDALFGRVLGHYRALMARASDALERAPSARAGIEQFLLGNLDAVCPVEGPRGCFLQLAANECQPARPEVAAAAVEAARLTEQALLKALRRGKRSGELAASLDDKGLARLLAVTVQGMAASARAGRTREELREVVKQAVKLLR
jgi:AcrR family transcriptional regulator